MYNRTRLSRWHERLRRWSAVWTLGGALFVALSSSGTTAQQQDSPTTPSGMPINADQLYTLTKVWTVHLKFTPEQWTAVEPKRGNNSFGGFRGGPGGGRGPNVAKVLTPVFMSQGDINRDGRLSQEEFSGLAKRWFKAWDATGVGKLNEEQLRAGLDKIRNPLGSGMMLQGPEGKRNGLASAFGIEFEYVHADVEFEGRLLKDVGVRYKGNGTFLELGDSPKRSFKIDLNKYVKGQRLAGVTTLNLQNNITDATVMNEVLAYRLYRDAGVPAPRTAYARVFVTVPGKHDRQYYGLYSLSENVSKPFVEDRFGTKVGAIFKPVTPSLFADLGADWSAYSQTYDPKADLEAEQKKAVMDLCRLVTQADDTEFAARISKFIDLPGVARFMAVMVYLSDLDGILGPGQNLYLYLHPKTQQFQFIPWDQDRTWGQFARASQEQRDNLSIHRPWQGENPFLERLFKLEAFKKPYLANLDEFSKTIFSPERLAKQVDEVAAAIRPAVQEESESNLARFDKAVAGETIQSAGRGPFGSSEIKPIKPFARVRTQSVREQLAGKSEGQVLRSGGFPGGGGGAGLGNMLGRFFLQILDEDEDSSLTEAEFTQGFARLFQAWNSDRSGKLTLAQLRLGIEKDLATSRAGVGSERN
jgi:hypothetical protein